MPKVLKIHPDDNVWVALEDIAPDTSLQWEGKSVKSVEAIAAKHKVATDDIPEGGHVIMYGTVVGIASSPIFQGMRITTSNTKHAVASTRDKVEPYVWSAPDVTSFSERTFNGYHRKNGDVGTRNHWLFIPLVFCENRNLKVLQETFLKPLGYHKHQDQRVDISSLIDAAKTGIEDFSNITIDSTHGLEGNRRVFDNIDGIKFLLHDGGCGCTRQDADVLCKLLASYIAHPNVGGATILSLGCQNAQISILKEHLAELQSEHEKPVYYFEQQQSRSERDFIEDIVRKTFEGLVQINKIARKPAPLAKLTLGLECGGSDGFSGLSANPALGHCADLLVALGGTAILAEFPELNGAEQDIINRCVDQKTADRFLDLMGRYSARAKADGSGFEANPSPGNIKDGLITDAIKSLGASKKGGSSPITEVLDYGEVTRQKGLNLLNTPGGDVESTTGLAGAGSNLIVFTTGLGTPTGNIITPTVKMSTNNALAKRMGDIIDINAGTIISGESTIAKKGEELLNLLIEVANGDQIPAAERLGQDDFIPWKRGISL